METTQRFSPTIRADTKPAVDYEVVPMSPARRLTLDLLRIAHDNHVVHGLLEVDVTQARQLIHKHSMRTGEKLSFTGFVIASVARAVSENRSLNAIRKGHDLIVFQDVHVGTMIERNIHDELVVVPYVVRSADKKTVREIHDELRMAQTKPLQRAGSLALKGGSGWIYAIPSPFRRVLIKAAARTPKLASRLGATVGVTAVGMFGKGPGWGIPLVPSTVTVTVGGIGKRPCLDLGRLTEHEYLCLTVTFNHDIVDGAPAARFSARLRELIESGTGLPGDEAQANGSVVTATIASRSSPLTAV